MNLLLSTNKVSLPWFSERSHLPAPIRSIADFKNMGEVGARLNNAICLTFDDGPDPLYTPKILDLLAVYDIKATFFVIGEAVQQYPQVLEAIVKQGHAIGNHTYSHSHPWMMTPARAKDEVARTTLAIEKIIGVTPNWFRPPFGRLRGAMREQAHVQNMTTVLWSHSLIDWGLLGTPLGISQRLSQIKADDIVLMHDGKRKHNHPQITLQCLPNFLRSLQKKSLAAVTLDEFIKP
jgi:peptidoglycan/xylan/chitin deacetylase (PgdA/CDA1 family)